MLKSRSRTSISTCLPDTSRRHTLWHWPCFKELMLPRSQRPYLSWDSSQAFLPNTLRKGGICGTACPIRLSSDEAKLVHFNQPDTSGQRATSEPPRQSRSAPSVSHGYNGFLRIWCVSLLHLTTGYEVRTISDPICHQLPAFAGTAQCYHCTRVNRDFPGTHTPLEGFPELTAAKYHYLAVPPCRFDDFEVFTPWLVP